MILVYAGRPTDHVEFRESNTVRTEWDTDDVFAARLQDQLNDPTIRIWDGIPISALGTATRLTGSLNETISMLGDGPWDPWQLLWSCISAGVEDLEGWRSLTLPGYTDQIGLAAWYDMMRDAMQRRDASYAAESFAVLASLEPVGFIRRENRSADPKTGFVIEGWDRPTEWAMRQSKLSALEGMRWGLIIRVAGGAPISVATNFSHLPFPFYPIEDRFFDLLGEDGMYLYISEDNWWLLQPHGKLRPLMRDVESISREAHSVMPFLSSYRISPIALGATVDIMIHIQDTDAPNAWLMFFYAVHCDPVVRTAMQTRRQQKTGAMRADIRLRWGDELIQKWGLEGISHEIIVSITSTKEDRKDAVLRFSPTGPVPEKCVLSIQNMIGAIVSRAVRLEDGKAFFDSVDVSVWADTATALYKKIQVVAIDDLTKTNPLIFIPTFYKSLCQAPLQPIILSEQEAVGREKDRKLLFPPDKMGGLEPTWYGCRNGKFPYPGLKRNEIEGALFPLVPCCFEKPQDASNRNKMLRMRMGLDVVTMRRKDNIIRLAHIIRYPGQLGIIPEALEPFFMWTHPDQIIYRVGMNRSPWSFMECLQYVILGGVSMPVQEWYPAHLIRILNQHPQWMQAFLPFHNVDSVIDAVRTDPSFWVNPEMFLPFMERLYNVHIRVWSEEEDGVFRLIRNAESIVRGSSVVYIIQHRGGRMDRLMSRSHPQCELIAHHNAGESIDLLNLTFTDPFIIEPPESTPFELWTVRNRVIGQTTTTTGLLDAMVVEPREVVWVLDPAPTLSSVPYTTIDNVIITDRTVLTKLIKNIEYHYVVDNDLVVVVFRPIEDEPQLAVVCDQRLGDPVSVPPFEIVKVLEHVRGRSRLLTPMRDPDAVVRDNAVISAVSDACLYLFSKNYGMFRNEVFEFVRRRTVADASFFRQNPFLMPPSTYGECFDMFSTGGDDPMIIIPTERLRMRLCYMLIMMIRKSKGSMSPIDPASPRDQPPVTDDPSSVCLPWGAFQTVYTKNRADLILTHPFKVRIDTIISDNELIIFRTDRRDTFRALLMDASHMEEFLERFCPPMVMMDRTICTGFVIWSLVPIDDSLRGPIIILTPNGWRRSSDTSGPPIFISGNRIILHPLFFRT